MFRWALVVAAWIAFGVFCYHVAKADEPGNGAARAIVQAPDWGAVVEDATVQVFDSSKRMGTGTVILPGVVITAAHILASDDQVVTFDNGVSAPAHILYRNSLLDVALLRILGATPQPISIDCKPLVRGDHFTWVGNPVGFEWNWGEGLVSGTRQQVTWPWLLPVSAPFNHGDSGAGVLDDAHHLRGIVIGMVGEGSNGLILPSSNFCGIGAVLQ